MRRRRFVISGMAGPAIMAAAVSPSLPLAGNIRIPDGIDKKTLAALARMARLLYCHQHLDEEVYGEVLHTLLDDLRNDPAGIDGLRMGIMAMNAAMSRDWIELDTSKQLEVMVAMEDRDFFRLMQRGIRTRLYQHPAVWQLIGYEGPSLEHGGYIHRGFNDIAWLGEA